MKTQKWEQKTLSLMLAFMMMFSLVLSFVPALIPAAVADEEPSGILTQVAERGGEAFYDDQGNELSGSAEAWLSVSKTIESAAENAALDENEFLITLDVKSKMNVKEVSFSEDAAVILVLDSSGSMHRSPSGLGNDFTYSSTPGGYAGSRMYALKAAVRNFIDDYRIVSDGSATSRYVAVVTYSTQASAHSMTPAGGGGTYWVDVTTTAGYNALMRLIFGEPSGGAYQNAENRGISPSISSLYTNIEGGLAVARNLLRTSGPGVLSEAILPEGAGNGIIQNRNVILFTDGEANRCNNYTVSGFTGYATSGSPQHDDGQSQAANRVNEIRLGDANRRSASVFAINYGEAKAAYLKNIGATVKTPGSGENGLNDIFGEILRDIETFAKAWIVTDPMGQYIVWDYSNALAADMDFGMTKSNAIVWDLKDLTGTPIIGGVYDGWFAYPAYTYKVKLDVIAAALNGCEDAFNPNVGVPANRPTILDYVIVTDGVALTDTVQKGYFPIPAVYGYSGDFGFTKIGSDGVLLEGCAFLLESVELTGREPRWSQEAFSGEDGKVTFGNIPSGHTYTLRETASIEHYTRNDAEYRVIVSGGEVKIIDEEDQIVFDGAEEENGFSVVNRLDDDFTATLKVIKVLLDVDGVIVREPVDAFAITVDDPSDPMKDSVRTMKEIYNGGSELFTINDYRNVGEISVKELSMPESNNEYELIKILDICWYQGEDGSRQGVTTVVNKIVGEPTFGPWIKVVKFVEDRGELKFGEEVDGQLFEITLSKDEQEGFDTPNETKLEDGSDRGLNEESIENPEDEFEGNVDGKFQEGLDEESENELDEGVEDEEIFPLIGYVPANDPDGLLFDEIGAGVYLVAETDTPPGFGFCGIHLGNSREPMADDGLLGDNLRIDLDGETGQTVTVFNKFSEIIEQPRYKLTVIYYYYVNGALQSRLTETVDGGDHYLTGQAYGPVDAPDKRIAGDRHTYTFDPIRTTDSLNGVFEDKDVVVHVHYVRTFTVVHEEEPVVTGSNPIPAREPEIVIEDDPAPLAELSDVVVQEPEDFTIVDEEAPIGSLPQTGTMGVSGLGLISLGLGGLISLIATKKKKEDV